VAALADRVQMTAPGLLYYFGTKERLLREVVAERGREELAAIDERGGLTLQALRHLGSYNMEHATLTRLYVKLGAENLDDDDPLHDFFVERYSYARKLFQDVLLAEQERGAVRKDVDTAQLGAEVVATLMGLEIQWLADPTGLDLGAAVKAYIDRLTVELAPSK
jgi:AcrR family transcriptional regulator